MANKTFQNNLWGNCWQSTTDSFSSSLNWWSSIHGVATWKTAQLFSSQIRKILSRISLHDLLCRRTMKISFQNQVSPWLLFLAISCSPGNVDNRSRMWVRGYVDGYVDGYMYCEAQVLNQHVESHIERVILCARPVWKQRRQMCTLTDTKVFWQISQFRSWEKWVFTLCLPKSTHIGSPRSFINRNWHSHWRDVTFKLIISFSSLNITYCRWSRRAWGSCRMITLLSWRCHWGWKVRTRGRTRWQVWIHDRDEVLRIALYSNTVFNEMCFFIVDPFVGISVFIAKLSERQYCWRVLEDFHCQEYTHFFDIHNCLFMRLHFSIGGYDYRRTTRFRQRIHFSITQVFFAEHVHWRSGVDNKFSFLRFQRWCKQAPIFRRWEECCSFMLLYFQHTFDQLPRCFAGTLLLPLCLLLRPILKSWSVGATLMKFTWPSEGFWSRMSAWSATAFVNFTRRIGFRMSELVRKIDEDFGGSISWNTQPNCRVIFNIATALLSSFFLDLFVRLFINLTMCEWALFTKPTTTLGLVVQVFWRVPFFTKWIGASSFEVILARPSRHSTTGTPGSRTSGSRRISLILLHERTRRRFRLCHFLHAYWDRDGNCNCLL